MELEVAKPLKYFLSKVLLTHSCLFLISGEKKEVVLAGLLMIAREINSWRAARIQNKAWQNVFLFNHCALSGATRQALLSAPCCTVLLQLLPFYYTVFDLLKVRSAGHPLSGWCAPNNWSFLLHYFITHNHLIRTSFLVASGFLFLFFDCFFTIFQQNIPVVLPCPSQTGI